MQDLTNYSDQELSLQVFNEEGLYNMRHDGGLFKILHELFIYTDEQRVELESDLVEDMGED